MMKHWCAKCKQLELHGGLLKYWLSPSDPVPWSRGRSPKLARPWTSPYMITQRLNDVNMRIQASPTAKLQVVHVDWLKPCESRIATELDFLTSETAATSQTVPKRPVHTPALDDDFQSSLSPVTATEQDRAGPVDPPFCSCQSRKKYSPSAAAKTKEVPLISSQAYVKAPSAHRRL